MDDLIVADSSPLISFARAGKLELIHLVCVRIVVPPAVYVEIVIKGKGKPGSEEIGVADWIETREPKDKGEVAKLEAKFGSGEAEALVLAGEIDAMLLADEGSVIREARRQRLSVTSTHLLLEDAKRRNLIERVKTELDALIAAGFRTTPQLIQDTLEEVGE